MSISIALLFKLLTEESGQMYGLKTAAYERTARLVNVTEKTIRNWVYDYEVSSFLRDSKRGKHAKTASPITDDPEFRERFKNYVRESSRVEGEKNLTCANLTVWVNEELGLEGEYAYKQSCIRKWLLFCNFRVMETKKGVYYDGHEREDVVKDRNERFIPELMEILDNAVSVDESESGEVVLIRPNAKYLIVNQDEKIHHSNEVEKFYWGDETLNFLPAKSLGRTVMTSDFVTVLEGVVRYNDEAWESVRKDEISQTEISRRGEETARRAGSILDVSTDGYYNTKKCIADFEKASDIIAVNYNGKYTPVFLTDHSPIHSGYAEDALVAKLMNVNPGGKQPKMRPGWFIKNGLRFKQYMVFEGGPLEGQAKGLKQVCIERFGLEAVQGKKQDQLVKLLENQPDFMETKPILQEAIEKKGGRLLYGVKFHPELMMVESCYRDISKYMRETNIIGCSRGYLARVVASYSTLTPEKVRKYFLSTLKFCNFYLEGENGFTVNKRMAELRKVKRGHRGAALMDVDHSKKAYPRNRYE